tara:strand:+ start:876 stop:1046 length:171 start_codon:yes stop_codon:yes gene_type:complete
MMEIVLADKLLESCEGCGGALLLLTGHPNTDTICAWCAEDWITENKHRFVTKGVSE